MLYQLKVSMTGNKLINTDLIKVYIVRKSTLY